jgi:hypothetical protein
MQGGPQCGRLYMVGVRLLPGRGHALLE